MRHSPDVEILLVDLLDASIEADQRLAEATKLIEHLKNEVASEHVAAVSALQQAEAEEKRWRRYADDVITVKRNALRVQLLPLVVSLRATLGDAAVKMETAIDSIDSGERPLDVYMEPKP